MNFHAGDRVVLAAFYPEGSYSFDQDLMETRSEGRIIAVMRTESGEDAYALVQWETGNSYVDEAPWAYPPKQLQRVEDLPALNTPKKLVHRARFQRLTVADEFLEQCQKLGFKAFTISLFRPTTSDKPVGYEVRWAPTWEHFTHDC